MNFENARKNMVDCQIHPNGIIDPRILQAFETLPRELFVPANKKPIAYNDEDIQVGKGRYLLEPYVHARMLQALNPQPDEIALDIGGSCGYSAAILSGMVMTVLSLENTDEYIECLSNLCTSYNADNVAGIKGELKDGVIDNAPYDVIFVNGAVSEVPEAWLHQLSDKGRMAVVIRKNPDSVLGDLTLIESLGNQHYSSSVLMRTGTPYLEGFEPAPAFVF